MSGQATYLGTAEVPVDELTPFPGNPRRGDISAIAASLRKNGQYRAIVVRVLDDGSRVILAGNHTWQALKAEGIPAARCDLISCDDETARRIVLADNKTSDLGWYSEEDLASLLQGLGDDLDGTGWNVEEAAHLLTTELPAGFAAYDESSAAPAARTAAPASGGDGDAGGTREAVPGRLVAAQPRSCPECGYVFVDDGTT